MEKHTLIHTHKDPGVDLFGRALYWLVLPIGALIGIALAAAPIFLYLKFRFAWLLILLVFVPFGLWMARGTIRHLRKLAWHDGHLSSYLLFEEKMESAEWTESYGKAPVEREIPLAAVSSVVASSYIIRQSVNPNGFSDPITETAPILYILYSESGKQKVLNVPFSSHKDPGMNIWLSHFQKHSIPLQYTARYLYRKDTQILSDEQRLEHFTKDDQLVGFPFTGTWPADEATAWAQWKEKETEWQAEEEARDPELKKARQKHTFKTWIPTVWLVSIVMLLGSFGVTKIGGSLPFSTGNIIPGLLVFTLGGFLFFYCLRSYLRWFYMITFSVIVILLGFTQGVIAQSLPGIEAELAMSIFMASILYPAFVWIPYLLVKKWPGKEKPGNLQAVPPLAEK